MGDRCAYLAGSLDDVADLEWLRRHMVPDHADCVAVSPGRTSFRSSGLPVCARSSVDADAIYRDTDTELDRHAYGAGYYNVIIILAEPKRQ